MPQNTIESLFGLDTPTPTPQETPEVPTTAPAPSGETGGTKQILEDIQARLDGLRVPTPEPAPAEPKKPEFNISLSPEAMPNTDEKVIEDLNKGLIPALKDALGTYKPAVGETENETLNNISKQLQAITGTVSELTQRDLERETRAQKEARTRQILTEVPQLQDLLRTDEFKAYLAQPIRPGAALKNQQILSAAEQAQDIDTIKSYVDSFLAQREESSPGKPPAAPPTTPQVPEASGQPTSLSDVPLLRQKLRQGAHNRKAVAEALREIKLK